MRKASRRGGGRHALALSACGAGGDDDTATLTAAQQPPETTTIHPKVVAALAFAADVSLIKKLRRSDSDASIADGPTAARAVADNAYLAGAPNVRVAAVRAEPGERVRVPRRHDNHDDGGKSEIVELHAAVLDGRAYVPACA